MSNIVKLHKKDEWNNTDIDDIIQEQELINQRQFIREYLGDFKDEIKKSLDMMNDRIYNLEVQVSKLQNQLTT